MIRGISAALLLGLNTFTLAPILIGFALIKLLLPFDAARKPLDRVIVAIAEAWIANNSRWMRLTQAMDWDVGTLPPLDRQGWYLVLSNHQSWVDILVLQHLLNRRIPLLKFFIKQQLIYVPVMGLAWWGLDFPFMRRHSEDYLAKHPEARGRDQETTRQACEKFKRIPTSVMSFLEGTRFTPAKHAKQASPYRHLLKPKVGGLAIALDAMGEHFQAVLDVTIAYPGGAPTFWHFMCGGMPRALVRMRILPVPHELARGDYANDPAVREAYAAWAASIWQAKDVELKRLHGAGPESAAGAMR